MAIAEFTIIPIGTGSTSLSSYVAQLYTELERQEGIRFEMTAMGTLIEGPVDRLFEVIRLIHEIPFMQGAQRVSTSIKIDDRRDKETSIQQKMQAVAEKLSARTAE
ncbi:MTH1187 family thiamine-binding protein [Paenibacillus athensensis]|uniref:Thiamine-binding protein domain-containing protein n=1 Tax=Paenibacillus athensensis TaxID=1967502 RepID=A0A4Y8PZE5_9BACL|nr:MTH1187 family thiamine-binding protein [Paenibacillus athensensis]MCD1258495.1 MTH1187 family thiamine-binding protein [Paenibacillus athensensis]